jgi:hypothetical protein
LSFRRVEPKTGVRPFKSQSEQRERHKKGERVDPLPWLIPVDILMYDKFAAPVFFIGLLDIGYNTHS